MTEGAEMHRNTQLSKRAGIAAVTAALVLTAVPGFATNAFATSSVDGAALVEGASAEVAAESGSISGEPVSSDGSFSGSYESAGTATYWSFESDGVRSATVNLSSSTDMVSLSVVDSDGATAYYNGDSSGDALITYKSTGGAAITLQLDCGVLPAGTYYVKVKPAPAVSGRTYSGSVAFSGSGDQDSEPTYIDLAEREWASSTVDADGQAGSTARITIDSSAIYQFDMQVLYPDSMTSGRFGLVIKNEEGKSTYLGYFNSDDAGHGSGPIGVVALSAGTYYVSPWGGGLSSGNTVNFEYQTSLTTPSGVESYVCEGEPNNLASCATPLGVGSKFMGVLRECRDYWMHNSSSDTDLWSFQSDGAKATNITISSGSDMVTLSVVDKDKTAVHYNGDSSKQELVTYKSVGGGAVELSLDCGVLPKGTYYVSIKSAPGLKNINNSIYTGSLTTSKPTVAKVTMYRLYNSYTGEHLYTSSEAERDNLKSVGWNYEGEAWTAPSSGTEVHRLYNPYVEGGDHHYTTNVAEVEMLKAAGWSYEGVAWYSADEKGGVPLYRQYNPYATTGTHNYTASKAENDSLVSVGWSYEGVGWYGVK
jgi:hypothetical protein